MSYRKPAYNELDYTSAVAQIRAIEARLLEWVDFERLINADSLEEALNFLANAGWKTEGGYEEMLAKQLSGVFELIGSLGGEDFLKTQRLFYDYHNARVLTKAQLTGQQGLDVLIDLGNIPVQSLNAALLDGNYSQLSPNMAQAVSQAYEQYAKIKDLQLADIIFDNAYFSDLELYAQSLPDEKVRNLIKIQIDIYNIKTFVRVQETGNDLAFLQRVTARGGTIPYGFYINQFNSDAASAFKSTPYAGTVSNCSDLELALDNYFMEKVRSVRTGAFGLAPLAAYFYTKENEIRNIRIVLTCKKAGIDKEVIRAGLRGY